MALSPPRATTSNRFGAQDVAAGADTMQQPTSSQLLHVVPSNQVWYSALSPPRANRSMRFGPHDVTAGADAMQHAMFWNVLGSENFSASSFHSSGAPPP